METDVGEKTNLLSGQVERADLEKGRDLPEHETANLNFGDGLYNIPFQSLFEVWGTILTVTVVPTIVSLMVWASVARTDKKKPASFDPRCADAMAIYIVVPVIFVFMLWWNNKKGAGVSFGQMCTISLLPVGTFGSCIYWWSMSMSAVDHCAAQCYTSAGAHRDICDQMGWSRNVTGLYQSYTVPARIEAQFKDNLPCFKIFELYTRRPRSSLYVKKAFHHGYLALGFEALLRQHYSISMVDIYWSLPMGLVLAGWVSVRVALQRKLADLHSHKKSFVRLNMTNNVERILRYYESFKWVFACHSGKKSWYASDGKDADVYEKHWLLCVLHACKRSVLPNREFTHFKEDDQVLCVEKRNGRPFVKYRPLDTRKENTYDDLSDIVEKALESFGDLDGDSLVDTTDPDTKNGCAGKCRILRGQDRTTVQRIIKYPSVSAYIFLVACIHIAIPPAFRFYQSGGRDVWQAVVPNPFVAIPILTNAGMTLLTLFLVWHSVATSYCDYKEKFSQLLCFDCMWRFPDESPLDLVRSTNMDFRTHVTELAEMRKKHNENHYGHLSGGLFKHVWKWTGHLGTYRLDFSTRDLKEVVSQVVGVNHWFLMRKYLQLDLVDERIGMEMLTMMMGLIFLPSVGLVVANFVVMQESGSGAASSANGVVNLQVLFDLLVFFVIIVMVMTLTLMFNRKFEHHASQVQVLKDHLSLVYSHARAAGPRPLQDGRGSLGRGEDDFEEVDGIYVAGRYSMSQEHFDGLQQFLDAMAQGIRTFDKPATLFGFRVDESIVGKFSTLGMGLATTQMIPLVRAIMVSVTGEDVDKIE